MQNTERNVINNENIEIQAVSELKIEMIWYESVTKDAAALLNFSPAFPQNKTTASPSKPRSTGGQAAAAHPLLSRLSHRMSHMQVCRSCGCHGNCHKLGWPEVTNSPANPGNITWTS